MKEELESKLMQDFPWMEAKSVWSGEKLGFGFPCECGNGWYQLIHDLCAEIHGLYKFKRQSIDDLRIWQIKEKYGGLRFYVGNYIDGVTDIIDKYENLSLETCEVCGKPGKTRGKGWVRTLCDTCADQ